MAAVGQISKPDWLLDSLRSLRPPERMTVTEWADRHRILDITSAQPGQWRTSVTPYLAGVMDAFTDPEVEEVWFCKPTQVGGSEAILNMLGYIIAQDPAPTMIVYPNEGFAKSYSKDRIQRMIELCPVLRAKYLPSQSEDLLLSFTDMTLHLGWAGSAASLAGWPIRFLFLDEVDKYPKHAGREADPISLAIERTGTFVQSRKIVGASTPTGKAGNIWKARDRANQELRYYVPCPHCGHYQPFKFRPQLRWPEGATADDARDLAWYECEECRGRVNDSHKGTMTRTGEWRVDEQRGRGKTVVWFHLNSIASPWKRFGEIAQKFLKTQDYPEELENFVNSWLAEPWENTTANMQSDVVMERQSGHFEGVIPPGAMLITGGVDVQKDHFYWTLRAWGPMLTSWNIAHGVALSWAEIEAVMNRPWLKATGEQFLVSLCLVDSGDQTDEVYEFCALNSEWAIACKGASRAQLGRFRMSTIDRPTNRAHGMRLVIVDGDQYKSMIASRMNRPNGRGSWMVYEGCDREYADQVTSEHRVRETKGSQEIEVWRPKTTTAANHYLDAEVYAAAAADLMQVRYLEETSDDPGPTAEEAAPRAGWIGQQQKWL